MAIGLGCKPQSAPKHVITCAREISLSTSIPALMTSDASVRDSPCAWVLVIQSFEKRIMVGNSDDVCIV